MSFVSEKNLDYRKLLDQSYDGAAAFPGYRIGVQTRKVHAVHALYIHCSYHRLQLAFADTVGMIRRMFGTTTNLWKLFYSPKKAEALKNLQSVLCMPQHKVVKPSNTRWLHMGDV